MMHAEQTATEASPELRILLVEDNEHDRVAFSRALRSGHSPSASANAPMMPSPC